ncbi:MAG: MBL fold metallo-hydrolase [Rhodospirillaceae bacterium]|jgi:glyoxylase-like metal-dependent hydrolase (beta-lactamase superfamily II)|nr:MBL fold metallo-hydrolase [Rhodospirillaceae bacterium]
MPAAIPFRRALEFDYGVCDSLSPLIRRVIANNPGPFTFHGTGSYIVGRGEVAVIDAGPDLSGHVDALLAAIEGETVSHLLVTHTHRDHSPATRHLKEVTGAKSYGFGPHGGGAAGDDVEEGADTDFTPDVTLKDGDIIRGAGWTLEALHTPGHTSNHLCFALAEENVLFSGDHVMGWSTTVVSPPDGNMADYMASLARLGQRAEKTFWPTHGPSIEAPAAFVAALIAHREEREEQILKCLEQGVGKIPDMVRKMYTDIDPVLYGAAGRSVLSHLIHMVATDRASCEGAPSGDSNFSAPPR